MTAAITIASVSIKNVLGIKQLEFKAGKFNEIVGGNGTGKTSVLDAIRSVVEGGDDATLLMNGQEKGEIVLVLSDNTTIKKRVGVGKGVTVEKDSVRQAKPQEAINALHDSLSVNPVAFLTAPPKKRIDVLLESLPMKSDVERIRAIVGDPKLEVPEAHALEQIDKAYKDLESLRRDTNRAVREREASITQLADTLPKEADGAAAGNPADIEAQLAQIDGAMQTTNDAIDTQMGRLRTEYADKIEAKRGEIAKLQEEIAELKGEQSGRETRGEAMRAEKQTAWRAERQPLVDQLNLIRSSTTTIAVAQRTRATMSEFRAVADSLQEDSEKMTTALRALEAYKAELLADLPIDGLTVKDGEIFRDGIVFDRLNEAQRVQIALELAVLRAGDLKIVCVDGLESLDDTTFAAFRERAAETDLQLFVTRVAPHGGDLTVNPA